MNLSKIVKSVVVVLPFAATVAATPLAQAATGLSANVIAATGAPVAPFSGGGASSFANWKITSLGAVGNADTLARAWVVPLISANAVVDKSIVSLSASGLCSTGSSAQLITTDISGSLLSVQPVVSCTGLSMLIGSQALAPLSPFIARVVFNLAPNGNAHWVNTALTF
jgi:hypothetical protein